MDRRSAKATAVLLILNAKIYEQEKEREVSRYRFTRQTLTKCSCRRVLRNSFLDQLDEELAELGWRFIQLEFDYAIVDASKVNSWTKLSSKRLREKALLTMTDQELIDSYESKYGDESPIDDSED